MAQVNSIQIDVIAVQNNNSKSRAYRKFYYQVDRSKTLSTRGFLKHIASHGLAIPEGVMQACLTQICSCLNELLIQGVPIKLDGLGTLSPYFSCEGVSAGEHPTYTQIDKVGTDMRSAIRGLHIRLLPDQTELDKNNSRVNLANASLTYKGISLGEGQGIVSNERWVQLQGGE